MAAAEELNVRLLSWDRLDGDLHGTVAEGGPGGPTTGEAGLGDVTGMVLGDRILHHHVEGGGTKGVAREHYEHRERGDVRGHWNGVGDPLGSSGSPTPFQCPLTSPRSR